MIELASLPRNDSMVVDGKELVWEQAKRITTPTR
jgi:hypothetical protein